MKKALTTKQLLFESQNDNDWGLYDDGHPEFVSDRRAKNNHNQLCDAINNVAMALNRIALAIENNKSVKNK